MNGTLLIGLGIVISSGYIYLSMQNINKKILNIENRMSIPRVINATQKDVSKIFFNYNDKKSVKEEYGEDYYIEELALPTSIQNKEITPVEPLKVEAKIEKAPIKEKQQVDDFTEESLIAEALILESIHEQSREEPVKKEIKENSKKSEKPTVAPLETTKKSTIENTIKSTIETPSKTPPKTLEPIKAKEVQAPKKSKKESITIVKSSESILEDEIKAALEEISAIEENNKN